MEPGTPKSSETRSRFPVFGAVCAVVGVGMVVGFRSMRDLMGDLWSDAWTVAWLVLAALAVLWGLNTLLERWWRFSKNAAGPRRFRVHLPRPGVVYLVMMGAMLTGSLLGRSNMLMLMFALMAGPFVINGWITFAMLRRVRVTRTVPKTVMAGDPASVELCLENRKILLPCWVMTVRDQVTNRQETVTPEVLLIHVPRRSQRSAAYQVRLQQRGRYVLGPLHVATRFPMGLVERGLFIVANDEILVFPRLGRLSSRWKRENLLASELVDQQQLRKGVFDDEFHAIREYRSGDNPKAIHWRTSARQTQLMVREFHQSREMNVLVLLDLWTPAMPKDEDRLRVELAISFAATLCVEQMRHSRDAHLQLGLAGKDVARWEGRSGPASVEALLEMLALAEAGPQPDWKELRRIAAEHTSSLTRALLVTTRRVDQTEAGFREAWRASSSEEQRMLHDVQVVEASPERLRPIFSLDVES